MDDLRSLEGMGKLLKGIEDSGTDTAFNRSSSMTRHKVPPKKPTISLKKTKRKPLSKAYSSRDISLDFDENGMPISSKFKKKTVSLQLPFVSSSIYPCIHTDTLPSKYIISGNEIDPKSDEDSELSVGTPDTPSNAKLTTKPTLSQMDSRSISFGFTKSLGLNALDLQELNAIADEDPQEEDDWYNDAILKPQIAVSEHDENEKFEIQLVEKDDDEKLVENTQINAIDSFPSEEFANYPNSKDNASNIDVIGSGSFGIVIKSLHLISGQTVAIKQCRMSDNDKILSLFVSESMYYSEFIDCKYVVDILGFGRNKEHKLCIALEYMDQKSLSSIQYALSESHLQYIAFSVLNALIAIHEKRYIHNDIKPDNILINSRGDLKLSDFGCCIKMKKTQDLMTGTCLYICCVFLMY